MTLTLTMTRRWVVGVTEIERLRKAILESWTLTYQREQAYVETLEGAAGRWATEKKKRRLAFRRDGMEPRIPG